MQIPRTMSTQHPDNVSTPFFATSTVIKGDDEVKEAYYVFSILKCQEQMWDYEGKEVDVFVVRKLLSRYPDFFRRRVLGRDVRLTFRVPNPSWEREEAKLLLETLESIPRCFDTAKAFYGEDVAPVFEVVLPMVTSHVELERVYQYYRRFVVGKGGMRFFDGDIRIRDWIGDFKPDRINVIPLIEDLPNVLSCDEIVGRYLKGKDLEYQRVFLARSDLALNYGMVAAVLALKIALSRLWDLGENRGVEIYPIVGFGSSPFRGNLRPDNVEMIDDWRGVQTFTIQSAFKYDYPEDLVIRAVDYINSKRMKRPEWLECDVALKLIRKTSEEYRRIVYVIADLVNFMSRYVPKRRERKLHIGVFGYSRSLDGKRLPRAIPFCCSLYSIGLPPELLGLSCLNGKEFEIVLEFCEEELRDAYRFYNPNVKRLLPECVSKRIPELEFEIDEEHKEVTDEIIRNPDEDRVLRAARIRGFLG